jgi:hypothetical protein
MKSSKPGAEKMATILIASVPVLSTAIQVLAGMKTVAPACMSLTESPRCTPEVPLSR